MAGNRYYVVIAGIISILIIAMLDYGDNLGLPYYLGFLLFIITLFGTFIDD